MDKIPKDFNVQDNVIIVTINDWEAGEQGSINDLFLSGNADLLAHALGVYACRHEVVEIILRKAIKFLDAGQNQKLN